VVGRRAAAEIYKRRKEQTDDSSPHLHVDTRTGFERNFKSFRVAAISFSVLRALTCSSREMPEPL